MVGCLEGLGSITKVFRKGIAEAARERHCLTLQFPSAGYLPAAPPWSSLLPVHCTLSPTSSRGQQQGRKEEIRTMTFSLPHFRDSWFTNCTMAAYFQKHETLAPVACIRASSR